MSATPASKPSQQTLAAWLEQAYSGQIAWSELAERLLCLEYEQHAPHRPDVDRRRRCGFGEVIYGSGKSAADVIAIAQRLLSSGQDEVLVTRVVPELSSEISAQFAGSYYDALGRTLRLAERAIDRVRSLPSPAPPIAPVTILTAGSTDLPVAREALETLRWMGVDADLICDVGVAGPYRLLPHLEPLRSCACVVVVAGMEGALVSVVGGLIDVPIIAVPTSVGYGANLNGVTTLLSMISSCAAGVTVVNIDAGFKGGYVAGLIAIRSVAQASKARTQG